MRWTKMPVRGAVYTPIPKTHRVAAPTTHGTWDTDRPPILGIVGRDSGQIQLSLKNSFANALTPSANAITCNKVMRPVIPL